MVYRFSSLLNKIVRLALQVCLMDRGTIPQQDRDTLAGPGLPRFRGELDLRLPRLDGSQVVMGRAVEIGVLFLAVPKGIKALTSADEDFSFVSRLISRQPAASMTLRPASKLGEDPVLQKSGPLLGTLSLMRDTCC